MRATPALALAAALLAGPACAVQIQIYHTNDIHGWIMARPANPAFNPEEAGKLIGGAPAMAAYLSQQTGPRLVLDAGDWFQGTPTGNGTKGMAVAETFNALGYDAVAVGNHDFDYGRENLEALVRALKMPVLAANVYDEKTGKRAALFTPWIVKEVGGVKVGIFGLLTTNMRNLSFPQNIAGLQFRDEVEEARKAVAELRAKGATVVIAVTHIGFEEPTMERFQGDKALAASVEGIDLIVGGHTHTFMTQPFRDPAHGTLIVQAGTTLSRLGKVVLDVDDKTGRVLSSTGALVRLWTETYGQDPALLAKIDQYEAAVSKIYDVVVATAQRPLSRNRDGEASLGDWMTDCVRDWAGSDVAIQNGGGIRADVAQGPVTLRTLFNVMPFDNAMVKLTMKGSLVADVLDHGVDRTKAMVQESGATFAYDRDEPAGHRLSSLRIAGKPLDPSARYTLATIDFLVKGGDGYKPFSRADKTEMTSTLLRDLLADCARRQKLIVEPQGGRMRPSGAGVPR